jgi:4-amino-4-deoxy-L-arabinose transferase-like glycosyltransferase
MEDSRFQLSVLLLIAGGLFFLRLDCALLEPEEARYAEIPREMLAASEWIVPQYHGQPYFDKPPLLYWLTMLSYSLFGVHDWSARLVPGLCGVLTVLTVYFWGRRVFNARIAFFGALVLALTPRFIYLGRFVATDAVLNVGIVVAVMCLHTALRGAGSRWWWLGAGLACGWGLLAKGPVAIVLIAAPATVYIALNARATRPRWGDLCLFAGTMLLVAGPWYALMLGEPGFAQHFFWKHHVQRFVDPFDHQKPFWFYLPDLAVGTLPWSLLLPLGVRLSRGSRGILDRSSRELLFPLTAAAWCLLFFSASGSKRVGYILPCFAPLALVIGVEIDYLLRTQRLSRRALIATVAATGGLCFFGVGLLLPWYNERFSLRNEVASAREQTSRSAGIVCYPRIWDSVSFYLDRDALVFSAAQRAELAAYMQAHDDTVLFIRDDVDSFRLVDELRASLSVDAIAQQGPHRAVRVSRRDLAPALASHREDK